MMVRAFLMSGLALMMFSGVFFGLGNVGVKLVSSSMTVIEIAFIRFAIGIAFVLSLTVPRGLSLRGDRPLILLTRGVTGVLAFFCLLKSITLIPLANAMVLFYTFPVFGLFFSVLIIREPVGKWDVLLIAAAMVGICVLLEPGSHKLNWGDLFGIMAGGFAGLTVVLVRKLRQTNGPLIIYFYFCLVGGIVSFPFLLKTVRMPSSSQFLLLVAIGSVYLIAQMLMNQGLKICRVAEGSVLLMSELVFATLGGVIIFGDVLSHGFLMGALLILASGIGLNITHRRLSRSEIPGKSQI